MPVSIPQKKGDPKKFEADEHPRPDTTLEALAKLKPVVQAERDGDGGECFGRERRLVRAAAGIG